MTKKKVKKKTAPPKPAKTSALSRAASKWFPAPRPFVIPAPVRAALSLLSKNDFEAYLVGGCVRDFLLELPIKDYDIATDATPDQIAEIFPRALDVGKAFGVMKIPLAPSPDHPAGLIEIATFREDLEYEDHRHPTAVRFAGALEDAQRRDFTINALYYDPERKKILDCVDGVEDLKARRLRAIGDPKTRFQEDALRLLRAVRFSTRFQFPIESRTWEALLSQVRLLKKISAERIRDELTLTFQGKNPALALQMLKESGILALLLPETEKAMPRLLEVLAREQPERSLPLAWASVLHELGGDDLETKFQSIGDRFRLSKADLKTIVHLVRDLPRFNDVFQMRGATLQRWVREPHFDDLLKLYQAQQMAGSGNLMAYELCRKLREEAIAQAGADAGKLLTGEDLIQLGLSPGPRFAEILKAVEDLALESKLRTKGEALEYVVKHFVQ